MGILERTPRRPRAGWGSLEVAVLIVIPFLILILGSIAGNAANEASKPERDTKDELNTKETPPSFKVQTQRNLVLARVVVRDSKGNPVSNLHQQDFRLFDNGKVQTITYFSVESPSSNRPMPAKHQAP